MIEAANWNLNTKFETGKLLITHGIYEKLSEGTFTEILLQTLLLRHVTGDWGDISQDEKIKNDLSVNDGKLLSIYWMQNTGDEVLIMTEASRKKTYMLLSNEN